MWISFREMGHFVLFNMFIVCLQVIKGTKETKALLANQG